MTIFSLSRVLNPDKIYVVAKLVHRDILIATYSHNRTAFTTSEFEVLITTSSVPRWMYGNLGNVPSCAVPVSENGERFYIGKVQLNGEWSLGTIKPKLKRMYVASGHYEQTVNDYEVLCL